MFWFVARGCKQLFVGVTVNRLKWIVITF